MDESRIYKIFGRRLAARRGELTLTQHELAARVDLSRASIANIERGHQKLPLHVVYRLAAALGLKDPFTLLPHPSGPSDAGGGSEAVRIEGARDLSDEARRQVERLYFETPAKRR
ncbi:XRE family transcriptional regulator [Sphingomonas parva]|uniref:XRE family transcriptional regulator n=1 Tax=Sphingomonas parva TaxID=2555898 RepID=A0A4Y8ZV57_9SPHN|nr:XRE family transcriptional regulator [Sphingomonas parva]